MISGGVVALMDDEHKTAAESAGDAAADFIHDLASEAPPKGLETVKAASDVVADDDRRSRVERRAYELWEAAGRRHGSHEDHWQAAENDIARDDD